MMIDLKNVFENKQYEENGESLSVLASDYYSLKWNQAFWLAKCLCDYKPDGVDNSKVIEIFEYAFDEGLTPSADKDLYIDACQYLSRLYINAKDYDLANNLLMELKNMLDPVPDWVYIQYCMSMVKSDTVYRHAMDPTQFFGLLDSISMESYQQRARVYQVFLSRLYEIKEKEPNRKINIEQFEALKYKYIGHAFDAEE